MLTGHAGVQTLAPRSPPLRPGEIVNSAHSVRDALSELNERWKHWRVRNHMGLVNSIWAFGFP